MAALALSNACLDDSLMFELQNGYCVIRHKVNTNVSWYLHNSSGVPQHIANEQTYRERRRDLNNTLEVFSRSRCKQMCILVPFAEQKQIIFSRILQGFGNFLKRQMSADLALKSQLHDP